MRICLLAALGPLLIGCAPGDPQAASPVKVVATNKQIMNAMTVPASTAIFNVVGEAPKNDEEWMAVENQAIVVSESANLLMLGTRVQDGADWIRFSQAMLDAGVTALTAAKARNVDAVSMAGDKLLETCSQCHDKYMKSEAGL
jgi:hypothetical protein